MTAKMQLKVDIISKVLDGRLSKEQGAKLLDKSIRTIERYLLAYSEKGVSFVAHGNLGKEPSNKKPEKLKEKVQKLQKQKYFDFNLTHLQEKLRDVEGITIGRETLRSWAHEINLVKKSKRRRGKKRTRRDRMPSEGLMIQLDGSPHNWFGEKKTCLIAAIDDATSELHAEFFESETTLGCMKVIEQIIRKKGVFHTLYVDRAGIFGGHKRQLFSQLKRACEELGIEIIFANSAEAKGRIERVFQTLQDRLVAEMRLRGIKSIASANKYLQQDFIPKHWDKTYMVQPESSESTYRACSKKLSEIFVIKQTRKVSKDHTISLGCQDYLVEHPKGISLARHQVEIRTSDSVKTRIYFAGKEMSFKKLTKPTQKTQEEVEQDLILKAVRLSERNKNVTAASKATGVSRQKIYRAKEMIESHGIKHFKQTFAKGLHTKAKKHRLNDIVVKFSLENPHLGEQEVAKHLNKRKGLELSKGTVRSVWAKHSMQTIALRQRAARNTVDKN